MGINPILMEAKMTLEERRQLIAERKLLIKVLREETKAFINSIQNPTKIENAEEVNRFGYFLSGSAIKQVVDDLERNRKELF